MDAGTADERFAQDLARFGAGVTKALAAAPTNQGQYDAMVSLAYNIGLGNFQESTLRRLHLAGDYPGAAAQFARWNTQAGKVLNGLTRRRAGEAQMYQGARG
jgi:lysozyme